MNYDGLWENKKFSHENQRFDWIRSIHWYLLVNTGWLADIDMFTSMIWIISTPWEDLVNKVSNFKDFVRFCPQTYTRTQQSLPTLWTVITMMEMLSLKLIHWYNDCFHLNLITDLFVQGIGLKTQYSPSHVERKVCYKGKISPKAKV